MPPSNPDKNGAPRTKCLSEGQTNGPKWHVRVGQMSGQSARGGSTG